ncbi:MAG: glycosyltransferase family 9 protein, partial [Deferribacteraceae bacterium]|nr:glycosyltransferase family 9 protein [Deferribacteraceae bacterium]
MRILLTQLRRIGDVITTTPAVRAVRATWQDATIDYLTESPSDEIFRHNPYIDNIITIQRRPSFLQYVSLINSLRANKYDVVIDFFCNPTSAYICFLSGIKHRVGFHRRVRRHLYTNTVDTRLFPKHQYAGLHKLALVANIGVTPAGFEPEFFIDDTAQLEADELLRSLGVREGDLLITMGVVVRHAFRQWPLERFAKVADYLIERYNAKILFIYG